ncbi:MAG: epoxyqueuosine reductase QueH [Deltaproteobacteria bacterium]|nr:epoxyqueuosine reductase QueH [Deltaproteobacteria bacterium]
MKVLLHTCCGPCAIVPLRDLRSDGFEVFGTYFNPNIHPYQEWERRREALEGLSNVSGARLLPVPAYEPLEWWRAVVFRESERCRLCYHLRLRHTALLARRGRFDAFSTTLLYSKFQKHELIQELGEASAKEADVPFLYRDWRSGWKEGVDASKALGLYRQPYCGCLLSEQERFAPKRGGS